MIKTSVKRCEYSTTSKSAVASATRRPRVDPDTWAACIADWRLGAATLPELADRTGLSTRAIQYRLEKEGATKGEAIAEESAKIERATLDALTDDGLDRIELGRSARRRTYELTTRLESAAAIIIDDIASDPASAARHSGSLRALAHGMALIERAWLTKAAALALKADSDEGEELPVIHIVDLTEDDIDAMRQQQQSDDMGDE
jgi:hypothetical protein